MKYFLSLIIILLFKFNLYSEEAAGLSLSKDLDVSWVIISGALVFFMQAGFLMLESGLVRAKNTINVASKNLIDFIIGSIGYLVIGFGIMFGLSESGFFGTNFFMLNGFNTDHQLAFFFFQLTFMATAATIVSGAVAERISFSSYIIISIIVSTIIYPVFGHWSWGGGWLGQLGFADFAGSTVVHSVGGWVSLAGVIVLGPRNGRFNIDGTPNKIYGHNLSSAVLGTMILWLGWIGFNGGSTLALNDQVPMIIVNTFIAASAGGAIALIFSWVFFTHNASVEDTMNGTLAGLVAITAGCNVVTVESSLIIGLVAGILVVLASKALEMARIDDVVGAFPVHGVNGMWGTIATAIFVHDPNSGITLSAQLTGVVTAAAWAFLSGLLLFSFLKTIMKVRVDEQDEEIGLNVAEHGAKTTIIEFMSELSSLLKNKDFRQKLKIEYETEAGTIGILLNSFIGDFSRIVSIIKKSALDLTYDSDSLNSLAKDITQNTEKQSQLVITFKEFLHDMIIGLSEVESMSHHQEEKILSATEMSRNICDGFKELESKLLNSRDITESIYTLFHKNAKELSEAANKIRQMHELTDKVGNMVDNISEISDQLSMLSINASIEAARSGEKGQGFAVVAEEIAKLSDKASSNTSEAGKYLAEVNRSVNDEISEINSTVKSFEEIYKDIAILKTNVSDVQDSSKSFSAELFKVIDLYDFIKNTSADVINKMKSSIAVVDSVTETMNEIDKSSKYQVTQVYKLENTSSVLLTKSELLKTLISEFKVAEENEFIISTDNRMALN